MAMEEILQQDSRFRYMLLGRMQSDCEFYLGYGNRIRHAYGQEAKKDR